MLVVPLSGAEQGTAGAGGLGKHRNKGAFVWRASLKPWGGQCGPGKHMEQEEQKDEDTVLGSTAKEEQEETEGSEEVGKTDHTVACAHTHCDAESDLEASEAFRSPPVCDNWVFFPWTP